VWPNSTSRDRQYRCAVYVWTLVGPNIDRQKPRINIMIPRYRLPPTARLSITLPACPFWSRDAGWWRWTKYPHSEAVSYPPRSDTRMPDATHSHWPAGSHPRAITTETVYKYGLPWAPKYVEQLKTDNHNNNRSHSRRHTKWYATDGKCTAPHWFRNQKCRKATLTTAGTERLATHYKFTWIAPAYGFYTPAACIWL